MKQHLKTVCLFALSTMALMGFASSASATTLEEIGQTKLNAITFSVSLKTGTSAILKDTEGFSADTCTTSNKHMISSVFTGSVVTGWYTGHNDGRLPSSGLSLENCTRPVTIHDPGTFEITHISGTTDGTIASEETRGTFATPFGTVTCNTGVTTHMGRLTGATTVGNPGAHAIIETNATLNCGFLLPSAKWEGTYIVTTPTDLGVTA